jgi:hypothetical protein
MVGMNGAKMREYYQPYQISNQLENMCTAERSGNCWVSQNVIGDLA